MRRLIIVIAILCFIAAAAIAGAGARLHFSGVQLAFAPKPLARHAEPETLSASSSSLSPAQTQISSPVAAPEVHIQTSNSGSAGLPEGQLSSRTASSPPAVGTIDALPAVTLYPEDKSTREMVEDLRTTVARLQEELALQRQSAAETAPEPPLLILDGAMLPPWQVRALTPEAREAVRRLIPQIQADPRLKVVVEGHSDSRPISRLAGRKFKDNTELSLQRAQLVADVLVGEGVDASRLHLKGWGDMRPLASNDTAAGRDKNRRVEIRLVLQPQNP